MPPNKVVQLMPEGPTIIILKEKLQPFIGKKIIDVNGYAKGFDAIMLSHQTITDIKSWGKNLLICFHDFAIRIHMGLFGSYKINERSKSNASLHMQFDNGEVNFYIANVKLITEPLDDVYDWQADVMNPDFDYKEARKRLKAKPEAMICDLLLDQNIFAGSGNIVKNEVLFRTHVQPESQIKNIPPRKLTEIIDEVVVFCDDFYRWRKKEVLRKHLEAHEQKMCPRNHMPFVRADLGKTKRHCYYCPICQKRY